MNPLTLVKRIQNINSREAALGISEEASWHAKYKDSAYVYAGGIPFDLTEGDLLAVFAQYGEIVDVNLVRDKGTGKSKGFAFIAYEDQRSTTLAVDNLNGAQILGRIIRVDHVNKYKKKEEEDEETERQKREARGVCRAFQRGECNRGAGCKFSHDEQRAANTGWGADDKSSRWGHDRFQGSTKSEKDASSSQPKGTEVGKESHNKVRELNSRDQDRRNTEKRPERKEKEMDYKEDWDKRAGERKTRRHDAESDSKEDPNKLRELNSRDHDRRGTENRSERKEKEMDYKEDRDKRGERKYRRHDAESDAREDQDRREEKRSRRHETESYHKQDLDSRRDRRSDHDRDNFSHRHRRIDDEDYHHNHRSRR